MASSSFDDFVIYQQFRVRLINLFQGFIGLSFHVPQNSAILP